MFLDWYIGVSGGIYGIDVIYKPAHMLHKS